VAERVRVGKRGRSLLFFAVLDLIISASLISPDHATRRAPLYVWLDSVAPLWTWSLLWGFVGLICLWNAFRQRNDRWGFSAAIAIKVLWGMLSLAGWLLGGVERGYVSAAIWLAMAGWVWEIAGWPEPVKDRKGRVWTPPLP